MKPVWVKVEWDIPSKNIGSPIVVQPKSVQIVEDLELIDGIYCATEYSRSASDILSIGLKTNVFFQGITAKGTFSFKRDFIEWETGIWVSCPEYEWNYADNQYDVTIPPLGVNQCGTFMVEGELSDGHNHYKCEIKVRPSLLTEEEYQLMAQELLSITEELLYKQQSFLGGNDGRSALIDIKAIWKSVQALSKVIAELEKAPAEMLSVERKKTSFEKLRKMDVRALLEKELYPHQETVHALTTFRSLNVKEHRKIKGALLEFLTISERNSGREAALQNGVANQIAEVRMEKSKLRDIRYEVNFLRKENALSKEFTLLEERRKSWKQIIEQFEDLLESEILLHCDEEEWGDTHLFIYHPVYSQAFEIIELLQKELRQDNVSLKAFQRDLLHSPDLYEKWVFLKVLHYFIDTMRFVPKNRNGMEAILKYYERNQTLEGFWIRLQISGIGNLVIGSEIEFSGKRPDISLLFEAQNGGKSLAFLDAKYKPYSKMPIQLEKDMIKSAKRYREMVSRGLTAFLVHPDSLKGSNYEITKPHRDGYFMLKPGNDEGLALFLKMVFHFHLAWETICPDCGERHHITIKDLNRKKHYTCDSCQSFWVQSYCWNKNHIHQNLYKYLHRNYHRPTAHDWDVHCPRCGLTFADSPWYRH